MDAFPAELGPSAWSGRWGSRGAASWLSWRSAWSLPPDATCGTSSVGTRQCQRLWSAPSQYDLLSRVKLAAYHHVCRLVLSSQPPLASSGVLRGPFAPLVRAIRLWGFYPKVFASAAKAAVAEVSLHDLFHILDRGLRRGEYVDRTRAALVAFRAGWVLTRTEHQSVTSRAYQRAAGSCFLPARYRWLPRRQDMQGPLAVRFLAVDECENQGQATLQSQLDGGALCNT